MYSILSFGLYFNDDTVWFSPGIGMWTCRKKAYCTAHCRGSVDVSTVFSILVKNIQKEAFKSEKNAYMLFSSTNLIKFFGQTLYILKR